MLSVKVFRLFIDVLYFFFGHAIKGFLYGFRCDINYEEEVSKGESFVSRFLDNVTEDCKSDDDSYTLENCFVDLPKTAFFKIKVEIGLYNSCIRGLKTLKRNNIFSVTNQNQKHIIANLGAKSLCFYTELRVKMSSFERTIILQSTLTDITMVWDFSINSQTGRDGILHGLYIHEIKGMEVSISGFGIFTYLINLFINLSIRVMKSFVRNCIEYKIENYMSEQLTNYQFPTEGTNIVLYSKNTDDSRSEFFIQSKKVLFAEETDSNSEEMCVPAESSITNATSNTFGLSASNNKEFYDWKFPTNPVKSEGMIELKCLTRKTPEVIPAAISPIPTNNLKYLNQFIETFPKCLQECDIAPGTSNSESLKRKLPNMYESSEFINRFSPTKCAKYSTECSVVERERHEQSEKLPLEEQNIPSTDLVHDVNVSECFDKLKANLQRESEIKDGHRSNLNGLVQVGQFPVSVEYEFQRKDENSELLGNSVDRKTNKLLKVELNEINLNTVFQEGYSNLENSTAKVKTESELDECNSNVTSLDKNSEESYKVALSGTLLHLMKNLGTDEISIDNADVSED